MSRLEVEVHEEPESVRLALAGELDMAGAERVDPILQRVEEGSPPLVVLDLREVAFIDSSGLRLVIAAAERARGESRRIAIVQGPPRVQRVFELTRLDAHFEIVADPSELGPVRPPALEMLLPVSADASGDARQALGRLDGSLDGELLQDLRLLVSELVTNGVRHGGLAQDECVRLSVHVRPGSVRCEVAHPGTSFTPPERPAAGSGSGWGLYLVRRIADRWGIEGGDSTCVWLEIDLGPGGGRLPGAAESYS